ncbi:MAG: cation:dicarboxylate symporter family transporter [Gammaproteobacteria bacterium]
MTTTHRGPGLGVQVFIGFALGISCGVFFGEMAAILSPVGRAYVRLLQMTIIPYITVSLISSLGRLTPNQASRIAVSGGVVLFLVLMAGMLLVLLAPLAYPDWEAATYFTSSLTSTSQGTDFVSLYISANPFDSMANSVIPAIVVFSLVMGVAVMKSERKGPLLDLLASLDDALINITGFVVKLAPIGIFAISSNAAGTMDLSDFNKLQVYIWSSLLLWALMFLLFLPGLLVVLTPIRYREVFAVFRIAFITAFVTGSVMVVIPMIIDGVGKLLKSHEIADEETEAAAGVLIPTMFNFPTVATLLSLSFILFSGWYAGNPLAIDAYPVFASAGLFVSFGGANLALPFLLDLFRFPADMFELFLAAGVITNFFLKALSAMSLVVLTLLSIFIIKGRITPKPLLLATLLAAILLGAPLLLKASGAVMDHLISFEYRGYDEFISRQLTHETRTFRESRYQPDLPVQPTSSPRLERIRSDGWLRVGYSEDSLPWVFRNSHGEIVGYDMELLHRLASEFNAGLEVILIDSGDIGHALESGQIDMYASGFMIDASRVSEFTFSKPYAEVSLGLLVEDHKRDEFDTNRKLDNALDSKLAVLDSTSLLHTYRVMAPDRHLMAVSSPREFLEGDMPALDALIMPAETASAWTLIYPQFSAIIPGPGHVRIPIVFALSKSDETFVEFVNTWIRTSASLGVMDMAYQHWILGRGTLQRQPRWSIIRDVLHWVE